jgi:hypothetical protein
MNYILENLDGIQKPGMVVIMEYRKVVVNTYKEPMDLSR